MKKEELLKVVYYRGTGLYGGNKTGDTQKGYLHQWVTCNSLLYGVIINEDGSVEKTRENLITVQDWD